MPDNDNDGWSLDDEEDLDALMDAWDEADAQAAGVLQEACAREMALAPPRREVERAAAELRAGVAAGNWPWNYFVHACGWPDGIPDDDVQAWLGAVAASISPPDDPQTDIELQSAVEALLHADWLGLVAGLVRRGIGAVFSAEAALRDIESMPEIESESADADDELPVFATAVEVLAPLWEALGVLDEQRRLTALGRWGLPHGLLVTWSGGAERGEAGAGSAAPGDALDEDQAALALDILAGQPVTYDELRRRLAREGVFASVEQIESALIHRLEVFPFADGVVGHLPTLAEGVVLTHRLTEEERQLGILGGGLDLDLWTLVALDPFPLLGSGEARAVFRGDVERIPGDAAVGLVGPEGWLEGYAAGDVLGIRYVDGRLAVEKVDLPAPDAVRDELAAVARAARTAATLSDQADDPGASGCDVVLQARRDDPTAFSAPLPPLSQILADADGLEVFEGEVGLPGTAWEGEPSFLNDDQRTAYRSWRRMLSEHRAGTLPTTSEAAELVSSLDGLLLDLMAADLTDEPDREPVVETMRAAVSGRSTAGPLYLRSRAAEGRGDTRERLELLEQALAADPELREANADLGDLRSVAGDAREAQQLYRLAGLDSSAPELQVLQKYLQPPAAATGRNKPCPCGSGKKYKLCHGRTDRHPLEDRAPWLWFKIVSFAQRGQNRAVLLDWAELSSGAPREDRETVVLAMTDPVTHDFAIFDGDLLDDFLAELGPLLPEDERELAQAWAGSARRLMEVTEVHPMRGLDVRDLRTEERLEIRDRRITTQVKAKDLLLGRPLDDGGGTLRFMADPVSLPRMRRGPLLNLMRDQAAAEVIARFLSPNQPPPTLQTTEGEEMVVCHARYRLTDIDEAWEALATRLELEGEELVAYAPEIANGGRVVRGRMYRDRDLLVIETNAIERLRRLQSLLLDVDPGARLIDESARPMGDLLAEQDTEGSPAPVAQPELPPELIREITRQHEDTWLDDSIPALGGHTPREAAQDPVLRPDLVALLDDFEWTGRRENNPLAMDVDRLRRELGIAPM